MKSGNLVLFQQSRHMFILSEHLNSITCRNDQGMSKVENESCVVGLILIVLKLMMLLKIM